MTFHGRVVREQLTAACRVTETLFCRSEELPWHEHATAYVSFLLAGAYTERVCTSERECSVGTVILHPPGEIHRDHFSTHGGHLLNLEFQNDWLQSIRGNEVEVTEGPVVSCGGPSYSLGLSLYHLLNSGREVPETFAFELLSFYAPYRDNSHQPDWFAHVLELIYDACSEPLTLAIAGRVAGVHPVHVSRSFRQLLGCTFSEYVGQVRLRKAFDLLQGSTKPVVDVAIECGFADHAHLCRSFKRNTGMTPSAYRAHSRG